MSRADDDGHEHDLVMPGFRFHPTEEELIEFYLRRKVEGKRFNVELITFLDLYRHDPWELPALAAIGEKEWFFYVPRDRKYRNGDRPNRVTRSGYWKATGAGRAVRSESSRSHIGVKKTLVFYSGKAPKGVRTSWIMNEYRLPQSEIERNPKADISLCRVYSRAGVEDRHRFPGMASYKHASSSSEAAPEKGQSSSNQKPHAGFQSTFANGDDASSSPMLEELQVGVTSAETNATTPSSPAVLYGSTATSLSPAKATDPGDISTPVQHQPKNASDALVQAAANPHLSSSNPSFVTGSAFDDLCKLANLKQMMDCMSQQPHNRQIQMPSLLAQSRQLLPLLNGVSSLPLSAISDQLWECNPHLPGSS